MRPPSRPNPDKRSGLTSAPARRSWKGFGPATVKLAPHSVISFVILDSLTRWYTGKDAM